MRELRKISGEEAIKILQKLGFQVARQRGSHVVLKRLATEGEVGCVVPLHRELKIGTLKGILKKQKSPQRNSQVISRLNQELWVYMEI